MIIMRVLLLLALAALAQAGVNKRAHLLDTTKPQDGSRIISGSLATHGQFPYMADVWFNAQANGTWICGGSLISDTVVLTSAAFCAQGAETAIVWLGTQNLFSYPPEREEYPADRIIIHPEYSRPETYPINDIALIIISKVTLTDFIQPIRLPRQSDVGSTFEGTLATFSGWGQADEDISAEPNEELRYLIEPVILNSGCNEWYNGTVLDSQICIYENDTSNPCLGDSGGPLVYDEDGTPTQIGIFCFVKNCSYGPAGFTRVTSFLEWIQTETGIQIRP